MDDDANLGIYAVLILILMEHAQRVQNGAKCGYNWSCLNPYFNGTCSKSLLQRYMKLKK